jgi:YD repeat-containing protein
MTPQDTFWDRRTGAVFSRTSAPPSSAPTVVYAYPAPDVTEVTDIGGRKWRFTTTTGQLTGIRRPSATSDTTTVAYGTGGVTQVTRDGVSTGYARVVGSTTTTTTITDATSGTVVVISDNTKGRPTSVTDQLGRVTAYSYDTNARLTETTAHEGNKLKYTYDARGNVAETRAVAKTPGTPPDIVTTAQYPVTCADPKICNRPEWTRDAKGNQTDYQYNASGQITSVKQPAVGGIHPEMRYSYTVQGGVSLLTSVSACRTTASCSNGADEVKSTLAYNANLQPTTVSWGAGDGSLTATTSITYDPYGNRTYTDGPLPGTADTTRTIYDAARQRVGVVGPDPDGAGPLPNRAKRITYNLDGQVTKTEVGTTIGQSDTAWAAFAPLQSVASEYDANARKRLDAVQSGSTTYALTHYSYDARGRLDCAAVRMNSPQWGGAPCLGVHAADGG